MSETKRLALVAKVTDKIGSEGKDVKFTFSTRPIKFLRAKRKSAVANSSRHK